MYNGLRRLFSRILLHVGNLLKASSKRLAMFRDIEVELDHLKLTFKSLSVTRWSCRWEAVKAVTEQMDEL